MKSHNWVKDRPGVRNNKQGYWYKCSECKSEVWHSDSASKFTKEIATYMAFIELAADLGKNGAGVSYGKFGYSQREKNSMRMVRQKYGETEHKGLHAILAKDCDACKMAIIGLTMDE